MRRLLLGAAALLLCLGALSHWRHRPLHPLPGVLAADLPAQIDLDHGAQLQRGDITLTTRAQFDITARVLSRKDYSWGADAELIPVDLALGWGRMSDTDVLAKIDISQSGRFYYWHVNEFPIPRREIETSSANMHMIPADPDVKRQLEQVRQGQLIHLQGFLVDASRSDGWHWNTSMTRDDTGAGACELVYVESIGVMAP
ncbi:hypothetical protein ACFPME_04850 [Rhodanobacter umsongensis]|uniref:DUF5666 domain-containing protein n=1 Tax=Rhodanobacter umsongensis TaxID=633153 RepID=A0ABW0JIS9_9GAMM